MSLVVLESRLAPSSPRPDTVRVVTVAELTIREGGRLRIGHERERSDEGCRLPGEIYSKPKCEEAESKSTSQGQF
jgi:hypothetical protein